MEISLTHLQLEPIGLVFVVFFGLVLLIQVLGMILHRWGTISHIISTTKLDWCNKKTVDETGDGALDKSAIEFVSALQTSEAVQPSQPTQAKLNRRNTVHQIAANIKENREKGANLDLEKEFKQKYEKMSRPERVLLKA